MGSREAGPLLARTEQREGDLGGLKCAPAAKHCMAAGDAPWKGEREVGTMSRDAKTLDQRCESWIRDEMTAEGAQTCVDEPCILAL
jgi:hypothetical protein